MFGHFFLLSIKAIADGSNLLLNPQCSFLCCNVVDCTLLTADCIVLFYLVCIKHKPN